ncbi:Alpha/Beta hydrolase protein [Nemania serpens]|nr:Alpha/Beta hydrolase protein [Nemania serpens]
MTQQHQPPEQLKGFESLSPGTYTTPGGGILSYSHTPASQRKPGAPVLVLLHGWPQTRYIWRYAVPVLSEELGHALFVPDLPGYGYSTMSTVVASDLGAKSSHDRASVGFGILSAVRAVYGDDEDDEELKVVLIGHDRGGRVAQRLITSSSASLPIPQSLRIRILGAVILDIVPYSAQWSAHANPRASTRYWHWSFLPTAFSVPMVQAYGGGRFCREIIASVVAGSDETARASLYADGAVEHYATCYEQEEVIRGAAADYGAGATEDWDASRDEIGEGRKVRVPVVVLYCEGLGMMHGDVVAVWKQWASPDVRLDVHALRGGVGHYIPEEAPEETNKHIVDFLKGLGL